ncbi:hypothetical protein [Eubacterium sp.]
MKKFESPEVEIIKFVNSDIITTSGEGYDNGMAGGDWYGGDESAQSEDDIY